MNLSTVATILSRIMWPSALLPSSWNTRLTLSSVLSVTSGTSRRTVTSLNARSSGSTRSSRDPRRSRGTLRSAARGAFRVLLWKKRTIQKCFLYHFDKDLSGEWRYSISMFSCMYKIVTKTTQSISFQEWKVDHQTILRRPERHGGKSEICQQLWVISSQLFVRRCSCTGHRQL